MSQSQKITAELQEEIGKDHDTLVTEIYQNLDAWEDATILPDIKNETRVTSLFMNSIVKPWSPTFTPTPDAIEFKPRKISVKVGKAELKVIPEEYRQTYLAQFMKKGVARTPEDLPFARYILEAMTKKFGEELNSDTAYLGVHNAAGTAAVDVANGWGTEIAAMITDGEATPLVQGAYTAANGYDKAVALARSINPKYLKPGQVLKMYMSLATHWAIKDQMAEKNINTGRGYDALKPMWLPGFENIIEMKPVTWMGTSQRVFITPQSNLIIAADATEMDLATINVIQQMWGADLGVACAIGFNFLSNMIWLNDAV